MGIRNTGAPTIMTGLPVKEDPRILESVRSKSKRSGNHYKITQIPNVGQLLRSQGINSPYF